MKNKIDTKLKEAIKKQDKISLSLYRELKTAISNFESSGKIKVSVTDSDVIKIINSVLKQHTESLEEYKKANRIESAENENQYISLLMDLLPPVATDEDIERELICISETIPLTKQNMGTLIKKLKESIERKNLLVDGGKLASIVKSRLI